MRTAPVPEDSEFPRVEWLHVVTPQVTDASFVETMPTLHPLPPLAMKDPSKSEDCIQEHSKFVGYASVALRYNWRE